MNIKLLFLLIMVSFFPWGHQEACASEAPRPPQQDWPFKMVREGTFDRAALQRGFQVYKQVCSSCHGMKHLAYRNLADLGFNEGEIKAIAAEYQLKDGPNDEGEMFERNALPGDRFVGPYLNEKAARAANNGAFPPDLSLITKARPEGANYVYALLTGYETVPDGTKVQEGMYYNTYFAGHQIGMAPPLVDGLVTFADGTTPSVQQMAKDVVTFLSWAAEPEMEKRHQMGLMVLIFLSILTVLTYFVMRKVWKNVQ